MHSPHCEILLGQFFALLCLIQEPDSVDRADEHDGNDEQGKDPVESVEVGGFTPLVVDAYVISTA